MKRYMILTSALIAAGVSAAAIGTALADNGGLGSGHNATETHMAGDRTDPAHAEQSVNQMSSQSHAGAINATDGKATKLAANHEDEQAGETSGENGQAEKNENEAGESSQQ